LSSVCWCYPASLAEVWSLGGRSTCLNKIKLAKSNKKRFLLLSPAWLDLSSSRIEGKSLQRFDSHSLFHQWFFLMKNKKGKANKKQVMFTAAPSLKRNKWKKKRHRINLFFMSWNYIVEFNLRWGGKHLGSWDNSFSFKQRFFLSLPHSGQNFAPTPASMTVCFMLLCGHLYSVHLLIGREKGEKPFDVWPFSQTPIFLLLFDARDDFKKISPRLAVTSHVFPNKVKIINCRSQPIPFCFYFWWW